MAFANRSTVEMFGYTIDELLGTPFLDYIHPDGRADIIDIHKRRLQGMEAPSVYTLQVVTKVGRTLVIENNAGIISYKGKPAVLSLLRDVTGGEAQVTVPGETVRQVISNLEQTYPGIEDRLCEEGRLRPNIAVVVDGQVSRQRLRQRLSRTSEVHFLPAISGG